MVVKTPDISAREAGLNSGEPVEFFESNSPIGLALVPGVQLQNDPHRRAPARCCCRIARPGWEQSGGPASPLDSAFPA
jgi:hypothetical protein